MNYNELFSSDKEIKISILGANGGFGYSLLAQCKLIDNIKVSVICDVDVNLSINILESLGWNKERIKICTDLNEVKSVIVNDGVAVIDNASLLPYCPTDMLIEATGNPELGIEIAEKSLINGQHVGMVSKETESVIGPYLAKIAEENGVTYTTVDGDQPSNLINLYTWINLLGLEIIVAGKSSEYDYIWNQAERKVKYLNNEICIDFEQAWSLEEDIEHTINLRKQLLSPFPQYAVPDYCEMNVVANSLGLGVDKSEMNYPICRITELADIFIPKEEGGILDHTKVVEVFNCLRREDELSFAGGEFVIVKCHNKNVWNTLKEKGHIVSKNGKYAAIILPYHLMGVESPISIFSAVLHNRASGNPAQKQHLIMVGRAERSFNAGETLSMGGHHHTIEGVRPLLVSSTEKDFIPFYLMANKVLIKDIQKGAIFRVDSVDLEKSKLFEAYKKLI